MSKIVILDGQKPGGLYHQNIHKQIDEWDSGLSQS